MNCLSAFENSLHKVHCRRVTGHLEVLVQRFMHALQMWQLVWLLN